MLEIIRNMFKYTQLFIKRKKKTFNSDCLISKNTWTVEKVLSYLHIEFSESEIVLGAKKSVTLLWWAALAAECVDCV